MKFFYPLVFFFFTAASPSLLAQAAIGYYPFNSILNVSSNPKNTIWVDARFQTNSIFSSLNTEVVPMVTFVRKPQHLFYAGVGANMGIVGKIVDSRSRLIQGYLLSVGTRIYPLEKLPQLGIAFEITPYSRQDFKSGNFRTWLGVSWQLKKTKEKEKGE